VTDSHARARQVLRTLLTLGETLVATLVVFLLLQAFVGRTYAIDQTSMESTLEPGQRVIVDELTPRFDPYKYGDIIVFAPPAASDRDEPLIKRVIGVSGDVIELKNGSVYRNGPSSTSLRLPGRPDVSADRRARSLGRPGRRSLRHGRPSVGVA
jgi:signal peptidase I